MSRLSLLIEYFFRVFGFKLTIYDVHLIKQRCLVLLLTIDSANIRRAILQYFEWYFLSLDMNALTRDLTMWLLDSIFFNVFMPNILLPIAKLLYFSKLRNNWHLPALDLGSKYCLIIYKQWRWIVRWGILPFMEDKGLSSTCMRLGVPFRPCEIEGVTFKFWIGD